MLKGKCPKCGKIVYGYALKIPRNQFCNQCGVGLRITDENGNTFTGYSPFYARKLKIPESRDSLQIDQSLVNAFFNPDVSYDQPQGDIISGSRNAQEPAEVNEPPVKEEGD
jgi:hypothetical protein